MATTPGSKKAKGQRLERKVAQLYRQYKLFPKASRMPMSGAMQYHKGDIMKGQYDEWVDECKNQEKISLWKWWNQTVDQCAFNQKPVLHIGGNYRPLLSVMRTEDYMDLRKTIIDLEGTIAKKKGIE